MVTRAAKDLLKNTIRSTDYHNKMIEEEEMWRHWEMEKGLTMMVTDDYLRRRMRMDEYPGPSRTSDEFRSPHRHRRKRSRSRSRLDGPQPKRPVNYHLTRELVEAQDQNQERWGHSGYIELYPEEFQLSMKAGRANETSPSGELEREADDDGGEKKKERSERKSHKKKRKKTRHKRHAKKTRKSSHFDTDSETEELRRGIRNDRRKKRGLEPLRRKRKRRRRRRGDWDSSSFSSSDSDVRIIGISAPRTLQVNGNEGTAGNGILCNRLSLRKG